MIVRINKHTNIRTWFTLTFCPRETCEQISSFLKERFSDIETCIDSGSYGENQHQMLIKLTTDEEAAVFMFWWLSNEKRIEI